MNWKWERLLVFGFHEWWLGAQDKDGEEIDPPYAKVNLRHDEGLTIYRDPRTGKPWKSMKAAKEWFDEAQANS